MNRYNLHMDKILLIDDDQDLLNCIKEFLELSKFEVIACNKSTEAVLYFEQPDSGIRLVLSDIKMPEKDGLQLFEDFKKSPMSQQRVPYVLMTGYLDIIGVENAYKLGIDELVAKPFDLDTLRLVINYLLQKDQSFGSSKDKYFPVRVEDLLYSRNNSFNIYIKVNDKYVLITKSGQEFTQQRLAHFASKGLQLIYLNNEDFIKYTDMQFLIAKQINQRPLDVARKAKIMNHLVGSVSRGVVANHVNKETFGQALTSFEAFTQLSLQHAEIEKILNQLIQSSSDLAERCSQTALLSSMVATSWGWNSGKVQSRIILSALMCDIGLRDCAYLITKKRIDFTADERKLYEQHPYNSFNSLKQIADIPTEIALVALEHHENALGMGFPQRLNRSKVHSYSKIVHCIIEFLETLHFQTNQNDIQGALDQMYNTQTKFISLQVLKTLYKVFNAQMPKELAEVLLPNETLRVA